jgi:glycosyltransferase involved in cell wall biosynthesis
MLQPYPDGVSSRRPSFMAGIALGVATVTTLGRLSETEWSSSGAAALVPASDVRAIASKVRELLRDDGARSRLGAAGAALYRERFDLSHAIATLRAD